MTLEVWRQLLCEGGNDCTEKVHCTAEEGEGGVRQLHAAGQHQLASEKTKEGRDGISVKNSTDEYFRPKIAHKMRISRHIAICAKTA